MPFRCAVWGLGGAVIGRRLPAPNSCSTRLRISGRCPECNDTSFFVEWPSDAFSRPHPAHVATVVCLLGSHPVGLLRIGGTP